MIYKILVKKGTSANYSFYQVQSGTTTVDYSTEDINELAEMYKALLASYTTEQIKLVHELEPELLIHLSEGELSI